jgi:hypothetical protein
MEKPTVKENFVKKKKKKKQQPPLNAQEEEWNNFVKKKNYIYLSILGNFRTST